MEIYIVHCVRTDL